MSRFWVKGLVLWAILGLVLSACGGSTSRPIRVGAIFDLTGATADVSTPYSEGVKGYVEWVNSNGGVEGRPIELVSADYAYEVNKAEELYSRYVADGAVAFLGWGTGDTEALRERIAGDKIPFMSASYAESLLDMEAAPYNFLVGTSYSDQAVIAIHWALDDWAGKGNIDKPRIAIIHNDSPFGLAPVPQAKAYAENNGAAFTNVAMPRGASNYFDQLAELETFGANYVIIQNVSRPTALLLKDAQARSAKFQFICLNWCADEILIKLAGSAAANVVGAIPFAPPSSPEEGHMAADSFLKSKGSSLEAKGLHYTQGWWTMAVMVEGIRRVIQDGQEVNGQNIRAALETIEEYSTGGVTAPINFSAESHRGSNALKLYRVEDGRWVSITGFVSATSKP